MTTCCCNECIVSNKCCGSTTATELIVSFDKNIFYSNEQANALVTVNNSKCKLTIKKIEFQVTQNISINGSWGFNHKFNILENIDGAGIPAGSGEVTKTMQLNLGNITYPVQADKKKKGDKKTMVPRSVEEMFEMAHMAPACHSKYIKNDYVLNVNIQYAVCKCCCTQPPNINVPMTIIPLTNPATYGFQQPEDFNS